MVAVGSVETYPAQFGGLPLELRPCIELATPTVTETIDVTHLGGGSPFYLHLRLHDIDG